MGTRSECDRVQEALVAGEQLAGAAEHAQGCKECWEAMAMRARMVSALEARPRVAAPAGMVERVVTGAIDRRRAQRQRSIFLAVGGTAVIAAAFAVVVMMKKKDEPPAPAAATVTPAPDVREPVPPDDAAADGQLYADLYYLSDVEAGLSQRARWEYVEEPIASTWLLVGGPQ